MTTTGAVLAAGRADVEAPALSRQQAQRLTERIRGGIDSVHMMLLEAYEKGAAQALGYETWEAYVDVEFKMSRSEAYRRVNQAKVIQELAEAGGVARAKEAAPYVSVRQAEILNPDIKVAAREIIRDVQKGMDHESAVRAAVERRVEARRPVQQALLPQASPAPIRRGAEVDEEELLERVADLRSRLKSCMTSVKGHAGTAPRREASDVETLRDELRQWLTAISSLVNPNNLESIYMLRAEIYDWLKSLGEPREAIAQLAGVSAAAVDYSTRALHDVSTKGKRTARKS